MGSDQAFPYEAKRRVLALIKTLEPLVKRDPEQEIRGVAVPVFEATLDVLKGALPDDPVVAAVVGAYAHEIETGRACPVGGCTSGRPTDRRRHRTIPNRHCLTLTGSDQWRCWPVGRSDGSALWGAR